MTICNCPGLADALRDLITAVDSLRDELRRARLARQEDITQLVELHMRSRSTDPGEEF